jgi:phage terminase large subunit GpA-like protein
MAKCDLCGNDYWMAFEVRTVNGAKYTFDSFECAVQKLAPVCEHCNCKIIGHGAEVDGRFFCCAHCAREGARDRGMEIRDAVGSHPG